MKKNNIQVEIIPYPILRRQYLNPKGIINYIASHIKYSKQIVDKVKLYIRNRNTMIVNNGGILYI